MRRMRSRALQLAATMALVASSALVAAQTVPEGEGDGAPADEPAEPREPTEDGGPLAPGLTPPRLEVSSEAPFPEAALEDDVEADVVLQIEIDETGAVTGVEAVELVIYRYDENGDPTEQNLPLEDDVWGFVPSAVTTIEGWRFRPAIVVDETSPEGRAVPVQLTWRLGFVISEEMLEAASRVIEDEPEDDEPRIGAAGVQVDPEGPVNLSGRLLERGTRTPLAVFGIRATLATEDGQTIVVEETTAFDGRFAFRGLPPGTWTLEVNEADYFQVETRENVREGEVTEVTYYIERNSYGEYVSTTTTEAPLREVTRRTITVQEIQRIAGNNNDAIKVVQNLPGVARASFGAGQVIIRGSAPEDTGFFLDGMQIPAVYHFGGLRAVFPSELLDEINFYPGGYSVQYGRATGGIVDVTSTRRTPDQLRGHIDANIFDTGVWLEGPISDNVHFQLGGRRSYIDAILGPVSEVLPISFTVAPRYYDWQGRILWKINDQHRATFLVYGSDDLIQLVQDDQSGVDPQQRGSLRARSYFNGFQASLSSQFTDRITNDLRFQVYNQGLNFSLGESLFFDLTTVQHSYRDTLSFRLADGYTLRYGLDIQATPGQIAVRAPRPPREGEEPIGFQNAEIIETRQRVRFYDPAHFLELDSEVIEGLRIITGGRMEYYRVPGDWGYDGRIAVRYNVTDDVVLKGAFGRYHQSPSPDEVGRDFGNPDLRLERALQYVLGTEVKITEYLDVNVEGFYKDLDRLVSRTGQVIDRGRGPEPLIYDNGGIGRVYGAELLVRHNLHRNFFGWIAYTLSRSERRDQPGEPWRLFSFDQTHILTLLGTYNLPRNWSVGARFRLVSGNPQTPIIGGVYNADSDSYIRIGGEPNSVRQDAFHQLDIRVDKRWIYDRMTFNAYLDVQNVYNRANPENFLFNYDFTQQAAVAGLPFIPSFGLRVEF